MLSSIVLFVLPVVCGCYTDWNTTTMFVVINCVENFCLTFIFVLKYFFFSFSINNVVEWTKQYWNNESCQENTNEFGTKFNQRLVSRVDWGLRNMKDETKSKGMVDVVVVLLKDHNNNRFRVVCYFVIKIKNNMQLLSKYKSLRFFCL